MTGLVFETRTSAPARPPSRADVACFVGFVGRRRGALPADVRRPLAVRGWATLSGTPGIGLRSEADVQALLDLPVLLERWEDFDRLFTWEQREADKDGSTYLGAAVRSFFAQGGRRCYVVRVGDPWPILTKRSATFRQEQLAKLIPGYPSRLSANPVDRASWSGVGHLFGLPEVSFLCLPDLADAVAAEPPAIEPAIEPRSGREDFVECSLADPAAAPDLLAPRIRAPRSDTDSYLEWASALHRILESLSPTAPSRHQLELQLVAAVPLPMPGTKDNNGNTCAEFEPLAFLENQGLLGSSAGQGLSTAFLQLAYPWVRTAGSGDLPETLEAPDAVLCGVLARNALLRGTHRSALNLSLGDAFDVFPVLGQASLQTIALRSRKTLLQRVCILGPTPAGLRVLSDVTTSVEESYRQGGTTRLVGTICRAAREHGAALVFEPAGETLWVRLRQLLEGLLLNLWQAGALRGNTPAEGFAVHCDRSTMSQNDIDNGRLIAQIQLAPALAVETITVSMEIAEGGPISFAQVEAA